ncbi:MAG TPA: NADH-quinone oxidoreductase subunit L [Dehalococcoidia bacterium]|nr:NADH-quinone oxidoreductase subunit L [Dehalococcoidia bacterium]
MGLEIAFWLLATTAVVSAIAVVRLRNIFRAALCLILCFLSIAGIFVTLSADFLAAVQILINVGAIAILIILAIMLTREVERGSLPNKLQFPVIAACTLFLGVAVFAIVRTPWQVSGLPPTEPTTAELANSLFTEGGFILPVEIAAILLLATIIGAIVLMREK